MGLMKDRQLSSEEKLLRLIRKKNQQEASTSSSAGFDATVKPGREQALPSRKAVDSLGFVIRILMGLSAVLSVFILVKYGTAIFQEIKIPAVVIDPDFAGQVSPETSSKPLGEAVDLSVPAFESYRPAMEGRDIFQAPWERPVVETIPPGNLASGLGQQLKLVGILLDNDPKAIIEDVTTKQTFFLSSGERIRDAVVEEIREDKVILGLAQEKIELVP